MNIWPVFKAFRRCRRHELYLLPAVLLVQLTFSLADACRKLKTTAEPEESCRGVCRAFRLCAADIRA